MNDEEFLKQLDKRLQNVATKSDLENIRSDFEEVQEVMATKSDLEEVKDDVKVIKTEIFVTKKEWNEKIDKIDNRVNDVYNLVDKIAKGIEEKEQEFYSREAQIDQKIQTIAGKIGIDFKNN